MKMSLYQRFGICKNVLSFAAEQGLLEISSHGVHVKTSGGDDSGEWVVPLWLCSNVKKY